MTDYRPAGRMASETQNNASGVQKIDSEGKPYYDSAQLTEFPRMMYRATEVEQTQPWADEIVELKDKPYVINKYDGLLCETMIAHSADEAEVLATNGWDITPQSAHGVSDGLAKTVSAKDERIAELEALLANQKSATEPPVEKRAPGRPRLTVNE